MSSSPGMMLRRYWPAGVIFVAGLGMSALLGWELHREAVALDRQRLAIRVKDVMDQLDARVEKTELLLRQLQDFLNTKEEVTPIEFRDWCARHNPPVNFPWLLGIAVATNANAKAWRSGVTNAPAEWSREQRKQFIAKARQGPVDCSLAFAFPVGKGLGWDTNWSVQTNFGASLISLLTRRDDIRISPNYPVLRDKEGKVVEGWSFYVPFYDGALGDFRETGKFSPGASERVRWSLCRGLIIAPLNFTFMEQNLWMKAPRDLDIEIFSSSNLTGQTWLNRSGAQPRATDASFKPYLAQVERWPMYRNKFHVFFATTELFEAQSPRRMAWVASGAGSGISLLAALLAVVFLRGRYRQEMMTQEVVEARDALAAAQTERERLGHDLHDGAIQSLYAIQLGLTRTADSVAATLPGAAQMLANTRQRLDDVIAELRRFILSREEQSSVENHIGLDHVLAAMVQRLQSTTTAKLKFEAEPGIAEKLSTIQVVQLTQIARTALANSLRHAHAREINVALGRSDGSACLRITDNGVGFDTGKPGNGGLGLKTMRTRASEAGGTIDVNSRPGRGTCVVVTVPISPAP